MYSVDARNRQEDPIGKGCKRSVKNGAGRRAGRVVRKKVLTRERFLCSTRFMMHITCMALRGVPGPFGR